jgi:NADH:ubiquinone oxidoreductase subunit C
MKIGKFKMMNNIFPVITIYSSSIGEDIIILSNKNLLFSFKILKTHINYQYKILSCLTGVDYTNNTYRFGIIYDILSSLHNARLRIKVFINDSSFVYSIVSLFINSDWWEREIYDMYGIFFLSHKDLRRILTDYGFEGSPQRKDFPLSGFIELKYDIIKKRVVSETLQLAQEFRIFRVERSW